MRNECVCDGRYDGCTHQQPCPDRPGGWRSEFFCPACDMRRIGHVVADLLMIKKDLEFRRRDG